MMGSVTADTGLVSCISQRFVSFSHFLAERSTRELFFVQISVDSVDIVDMFETGLTHSEFAIYVKAST